MYGIVKQTPENMAEVVKGEEVIGESVPRPAGSFGRGFRWFRQLGSIGCGIAAYLGMKSVRPYRSFVII